MTDILEAESAKERRKRQNRLNQQARRKRLADQALAKGPTQKWVIYSAPARRHDRQGDPSLLPAPASVHPAFCLQPKLNQMDRLKDVQSVVVHNFLQHTLDEQLLTPVTRHNIIRAMIENATYLGLTVAMLQDDIVSPFNNTFGTAVFGTADLPPTLQPTALQRETVHHPWIDLFPISSLRDALLLGADAYDEDELCHDLFFGPGGANERQVGVVSWGEAWDPSAYELSESILKKWYWLLGRCQDIMQSTNHWRSKRNKGPIRLAAEASCESS